MAAVDALVVNVRFVELGVVLVKLDEIKLNWLVESSKHVINARLKANLLLSRVSHRVKLVLKDSHVLVELDRQQVDLVKLVSVGAYF